MDLQYFPMRKVEVRDTLAISLLTPLSMFSTLQLTINH